MAYMYVDIDLSDVDDDELIDELKERGHRIIKDDSSVTQEALTKIYLLRRQGLPYDHLMDVYIYDMLGKVV